MTEAFLLELEYKPAREPPLTAPAACTDIRTDVSPPPTVTSYYRVTNSKEVQKELTGMRQRSSFFFHSHDNQSCCSSTVAVSVCQNCSLKYNG